MAIRRAMMLGQKPGGLLPNEYQQVDYLQSSGTQYIDTGKYYNADDTISIEVTPLEANVDKAFCGGYESGEILFEFGFRVNKFRFDIQYEVTAYEVGTKYKVTKSGRAWSVDDTFIINTMFNKNVDKTYILFGRHYTDNIGNYKLSKVKIHSFKHTRGNETILNLVPCIRKADSKPGMYDLVSGTFYTNDGTGEFITPQ